MIQPGQYHFEVCGASLHGVVSQQVVAQMWVIQGRFQGSSPFQGWSPFLFCINASDCGPAQTARVCCSPRAQEHHVQTLDNAY